MRGTIDGLPSARPLGETVPAVYQQDWYTQQLCAAFDELLAPVFTTLDSFDAYLDPSTAPEDMLGWLAGWIGLTFVGRETEARRRDLVRAGVRTLAARGTARSVREAVAAVFDVEPEIEESGGIVASTTPGTPSPGNPHPLLTVRLVVTDRSAIDERRLDALVDAVKPAHIPHHVEVVTATADDG
ncbi:phage tail protein [Nocardia testacea]|uniref:Phage tail protein n=1 Tax=Nocardia testacea TaxID=248551 RepID=A0ABW7VQ37_9NOCA